MLCIDIRCRRCRLKLAKMLSIPNSRHRILAAAAACEPHNSVCPQALYIAFFDGESDRVKAENPKLKHSQVQQEVGPNDFTFAAAAASLTLIRAQVWQRWQRSPQNPKNQPRVAKGGDAGAEE